MAAEAALMARMSSGFSVSAESENIMTCTSFRIPCWNRGRSGRSVRRAVRMASVDGRPSRRKKEPGILPPAYRRSSYSTDKREEINSFPDAAHGGGREDHCVADAHRDGAAGLGGQLAGLEDDGAACRQSLE